MRRTETLPCPLSRHMSHTLSQLKDLGFEWLPARPRFMSAGVNNLRQRHPLPFTIKAQNASRTRTSVTRAAVTRASLARVSGKTKNTSRLLDDQEPEKPAHWAWPRSPRQTAGNANANTDTHANSVARAILCLEIKDKHLGLAAVFQFERTFLTQHQGVPRKKSVSIHINLATHHMNIAFASRIQN